MFTVLSSTYAGGIEMDKKVILHGELSRLLYRLGHSDPSEINHIVSKMVDAYFRAKEEIG